MNEIKIDTILVPTDFSENAACAYRCATSLAKAFAAKILLVHVTEPFVYSVGLDQVAIGWEEIEDEIREGVEGQLRTLSELFDPGIEVETVRCEGSPFVQLVRLAKDRAVDMIVMATHGHTGFNHLLLGSTAEKVVRKAGCPVLTVHPGDRSFELP